MTDLHLLIASSGGFIDPGMAIYNFLRRIPVNVTTYNYANVDSVATVIYCAGKRRLASPHCKFLIHGVTWNITQPTILTEQQVREIVGGLDAVKRNVARVIAETAGKSIETVAADMSKALTLQAEEAKAYGLVHELTQVLIPAAADLVGIR